MSFNFYKNIVAGIVLFLFALSAAEANATDSITYSPSSYTFSGETVFTVYPPTVTGTTPTVFMVSPALPAGVEFNKYYGSMAYQGSSKASPKTTYTVTAQFPDGVFASTQITIEVVMPSPSPTPTPTPTPTPAPKQVTVAVSYVSPSSALQVDLPIESIAPAVTKGKPVLYSISPALPAGLVLNASSGVISGTPTALLDSTEFTVTVNNSSTAIVTLAVNVPPPSPLPTMAPSSIKVTSGLMIPNPVGGRFPNAIDFYIPSTATSAVVFLHGGGGSKEGMANGMGIKTDSSTSNYDVTPQGAAWLENNNVMAVFPQGQAVASDPAATTWSNLVMTSGQNDEAFLQALASYIRSSRAFSGITKIYLAGHSNGGMMTNLMWCESPNTFDAYGTLAGPPSDHFDGAQDFAKENTSYNTRCNPSVVQPYIGIVGKSDKVLQTSGNFSASTWTIASSLVNSSVSSWIDAPPNYAPQVLNDQLFQSTRAGLRCSANSVTAPTSSGLFTMYSDCSASLQLIEVTQATVGGKVSGGDHCLNTPLAPPCVTTLNGNTGLDYKTTLFNFFQMVAPAN